MREKKRTLKQVKKSITDLMEKNAELMKELEALNVAVNERRHIHDISGQIFLNFCSPLQSRHFSGVVVVEQQWL